jgi:hypothetical protein
VQGTSLVAWITEGLKSLGSLNRITKSGEMYGERDGPSFDPELNNMIGRTRNGAHHLRWEWPLFRVDGFNDSGLRNGLGQNSVPSASLRPNRSFADCAQRLGNRFRYRDREIFDIM